MTKKYVPYARIPATEIGSEQLSIDAQKAKIEAFVSNSDFEMLNEINEIGTDTNLDRAALQQLFELAKNNPGVVIITTDFKNLAKDKEDLDAIVAKLLELGAELQFVE